MTDYRLANDVLSLTLDESGTLQALVNLRTGHDAVAVPGSPLWKLVFRDEISLENAIYGVGQPGQIRPGGSTLTITYTELSFAGGHLPIHLELSLRLDGDEIVANATVVNRAAVTVAELWFPMLDGIGSVSGSPQDDALLLPHSNGRRIAHPLANLGPDDSNPGYSWSARQINLLYPGPASLPWLALTSPQETLYLASTDQRLDTTCLSVERTLEPTCLSLRIVRFPEVEPGQRWVSEPAVVSFHNGDWHTSARKYRSWLDTWIRWAEPPAWVVDMPAWQLTIMRAQYGGITWDYAGIRALWEGARSAGVDTLFLFAWWDAGHDNRYPEPYTPSDPMGGSEALLPALQHVLDDGGHAILYTQGRLIDPATEFYRREGAAMAVKSIWGTEYREQYNFWYESAALATCSGKSFVMACPSHPRWREVLLEQGEHVRSLGASGVLYDQIGGTVLPYLCYDRDHPHSRPADGFAAPMMRDMWTIRDTLKSQNADFAVVTENLSDVLCSVYDVVHGGGFGCHSGPQSFPELFRYTVPEILVTNRMVGIDEMADLSFGFLYGYRFDLEPLGARGHLGQTPELAQRVKRLCDLRRQFRPSLLRGRFVDDEHVDLDGMPVLAKAFVGDGQAAVVCWNPAQQPLLVRPTYEGLVPSQTILVDGTARKKEELAPDGLALFIYEG